MLFTHGNSLAPIKTRSITPSKNPLPEFQKIRKLEQGRSAGFKKHFGL
jgi:hypothetical protein